MKVINEQENPQLKILNEMKINVKDSLPEQVELSIYYPKLKHLLHSEIINFCREQTEMKQDLNFLRMSVGTEMTEKEIRDYLDGLKEKYSHYENIGLEYHIEVTRYDYGVPVICIIKRADISMKKFVFRFKKSSVTEGMSSISIGGIPKKEEDK